MAGPGDKFQPILCAREGSSDRHGGRIGRYETRSGPEAEAGVLFTESWCAQHAVAASFAPGGCCWDVGSATEFGARRGLVTDAWT